VREASNGQLSMVDVSHAYERGRKGSALSDANFTIPAGEFWTLLGPSGSGKSTLLSIIGGYIQPNQGHVFLNGRDITHLPPRRRDMGMVFQDYALFPHMTVFENIAYGLRARGLDNREVQVRVAKMLDLNHLTGLEQRHPNQLSGGQQQRVALARALVIRPSVLLMDEALGALDLKLRESMQIEVRKIQRELATTTIHVTHDQAEALTMSDRIVIIHDGRIEQIGTPEELQARPANRFVAEFVGSNNVIPISIGSSSGNGVRGAISGIEGELVLCARSHHARLGSACFLVVRPEDMRISSCHGSPSVPGLVVATRYLGTSRCLVIEIASQIEVLALEQTVQYQIGDRLYVSWAVDRAFIVSETATTSPAAVGGTRATKAMAL
jgi:ABC-type Fe3+/spermidine/putrescine transport system ATPase subunit